MGKHDRQGDSAVHRAAPRFDALAESRGQTSFIVDLRGRVVASIGSTLQRGDNLISLLHPDDRPLATATLAELARTANIQRHIEVRIGEDPATWRWFEVDATTMTDGEEVTAVAAIVTDVTRHRRAFDRLRADEARYRALLARSRDVFLITNTDRVTTYVSPTVEVLLGWTPEEFSDRAVSLIHPDDAAAYQQTVDACFTEGSAAARTMRIRHRDGSWRWIEISGIDLIDDPRVNGIFHTLHEVTQKVEAQRELRASEERFRKLVQHGSDITFVVDDDYRITWINPVVERVLGYSPTSLLGRSVEDFVHPDEVGPTGKEVRHMLREGIPSGERIVRVRDADGEWHSLAVVATDLRDDADIAGILINARDVTDRVAAGRALETSEAHYRTLVENALDVVQITDEEGMIIWISPSVLEVLGYRDEDLIGGYSMELAHPDDIESANQVYEAALANPGQTFEMALRVRHANGGWRWVDARLTNRLDDPVTPGVISTFVDSTERQEAVRDAGRLTAIADTTADLITIVDPEAGPVFLNTAARRFLGVGDDDDISDIDILARMPASSRPIWDDEVIPALSTQSVWQGEINYADHTGRIVPLEAEIIAHRDANGRVDVVSTISRDISERKALEARLEHQATHDPLTGLPNRTLFLDRLNVAMRRAQRTHRSAAVLFLDLDHFKVVNDSLGHNLGDQLLVELAERLTATIRPGDTVARFGGDEFVVLCEDLHEEGEAVAIARRVTDAINTPVDIDGNNVSVSASIGIAYADDINTAEQLLRDADAAMYQAKDLGRSRSEVFETGARDRELDRQSLGEELRHAIERDQLRIHYQPQIALATGKIVGVEALMRWDHPDRGLLLPAAFLPVAEEANLMVPLGRWLAGEACAALDRVQEALPDLEPLLIGINMSATQLANPDLIADLRDVLADTEVAANRVDLEITEQDLTDIDLTETAFARLKTLGVRLSVDDVSMDYTTMQTYRNLPIDLLKVDQGLIAGLGVDDEDSKVVQAVIGLAHSLNLKAVAEGVETAAQLTELRKLGCDLAQGYFIAHPLPEAELLDLLASDPVWWIFEGGLRSGVWSGWVDSD